MAEVVDAPRYVTKQFGYNPRGGGEYPGIPTTVGSSPASLTSGRKL